MTLTLTIEQLTGGYSVKLSKVEVDGKSASSTPLGEAVASTPKQAAKRAGDLIHAALEREGA